jgi:hypothetical protein
VATKENLEDLMKVGESLLKKPVSRVNLETGRVEPTKEGTNEQALVRLIHIIAENVLLNIYCFQYADDGKIVKFADLRSYCLLKDDCVRADLQELELLDAFP